MDGLIDKGVHWDINLFNLPSKNYGNAWGGHPANKAKHEDKQFVSYYPCNYDKPPSVRAPPQLEHSKPSAPPT